MYAACVLQVCAFTASLGAGGVPMAGWVLVKCSITAVPCPLVVDPVDLPTYLACSVYTICKGTATVSVGDLMSALYRFACSSAFGLGVGSLGLAGAQ